MRRRRADVYPIIIIRRFFFSYFDGVFASAG